MQQNLEFVARKTPNHFPKHSHPCYTIPMNPSGWNLQQGTLPFRHLSESDVIRIVNLALSPAKKHTSTYKYAFFKAVLDNLFNVDSQRYFLSYDTIALRFTEIYWNLVLNYHLKQMPTSQRATMTAVERVLYDFCKKYGFDYESKGAIFPFESLRQDLQLELSRKIRSQMLKYVVGAFYTDTEGQLYSFSKEEGGIHFNPDAYTACIKFKTDFEKINYYEWIKYLEKVNREEDAYALASKLDASTERCNLTSYRQALQQFGQQHCFYCHKSLKQEAGTSPVDHCIPWSFVKDDKLWNFVLSCPTCNSAKSNTLPAESYLAEIKRRNLSLLNLDLPLVREDFKSYSHTKLEAMYRSAIFNGFQSGWKPHKVVPLSTYGFGGAGYSAVADGE